MTTATRSADASAKEAENPRPQPPHAAAGHAPLRYCNQPAQAPRQFNPDVPAGRASAILAFDKKWVNGTQLTYYCFKPGDAAVPRAWHGSADDIDAVDAAFAAWAALGLGIGFRRVARPEDAQVRIGFDPDDGSWSYVGRDLLGRRDPAERTMNFGWPLTTPYGRDTALHEIGHTLGLEHEHQNPFAGIEWNRDAVLEYFQGPPNNWPPQQIEWNVLRKIGKTEVKGTDWDPDSIMEYQFGPDLISAPARYRGGLTPRGGLSDADRSWVLKSYPPIGEKPVPRLEVGVAQPLDLAAGETRVFDFEPPGTRIYRISTSGTSDTVLVLFEVTAAGNVQIASDDDSGSDLNAQISARLVQGRRYRIGVRLYYEKSSARTRILVS